LGNARGEGKRRIIRMTEESETKSSNVRSKKKGIVTE
jgi:hypothetical protein